MRKASLSMVYLGIIALLLAGCNTESNTNSSNTVAPSSPAPAVSPPPPSPVAVTPAPQPPTTVTASGLIQPTNPDERARQVQKGRTDPFAVFPTQPEIEPAKDVPAVPSLAGGNTPKTQNSNPQYFIAPCPGGSGLQCRYPVKPGGSGPVATNRPETSTKAATNRPNPTKTATNRPNPTKTATNRPNPTKTATNRPKTPGQVAINRPPDTIPGLPPGGQTPGTGIPPGQLPGTPPTGLPPEVPAVQEPELAKRVEVTGVVEVGGRMFAIVKAPNETTSRYVQAGDTLADGQITVQRIEMNEGSAPIVVLAQYGVEVTRAVGDKGDTPGGTPAPPSASIILEQPSAPPSASINPEQPSAPPSASINPEQPSAAIDPEQPPTSSNIPQNVTVPPTVSVNNTPQP
jgi:hypothetical protein